MPNNWILSQIAFPPPNQDFYSKTTIYGQRKPRVSEALQKEIETCCLVAQIDPYEHVGIPRPAPKNIPRLEKGSSRPLEKVKRQNLIYERMKTMDDRIKQYRKERNERKNKK